MAAAKPSQLLPLTSMRFAAAASVVFHHFAYLSGVYPKTDWVNYLLGLGYISVNFFFILSGFVLAWNYIDAAGDLQVSRTAFWKARFARLYPAYALALLFALPKFVEMAIYGSPVSGAQPLDNPGIVIGTAVTTPLLLQGWFGLVGWNSVAWSLSVEAFFYLTFPLIASRIGRATRTQLIALAAVATIVPMALADAVFGGTVHQGRPASWYEITSLTEGFFYGSPLIHWPEFVLGVVVGRLFQRRSLEGRLSTWRAGYDYAITGATVLFLVVMGILPGPIFVAIMAPALALLIFSLAHSRSMMARALSAAPLTLLGNASYSLYLFHAIFIQVLVDVAKVWGVGWMLSWPTFIVCFLLTVVFTIAVYKWVEEPAKDWISPRASPAAG